MIIGNCNLYTMLLSIFFIIKSIKYLNIYINKNIVIRKFCLYKIISWLCICICICTCSFIKYL